MHVYEVYMYTCECACALGCSSGMNNMMYLQCYASCDSNSSKPPSSFVFVASMETYVLTQFEELGF